jgi:hypothetical protein
MYIRLIGAMAAVIATFGLAGCAMTKGNLASSAEDLERRAVALHEQAREGRASMGYTRDAQEFASEARDFRRLVEDRRIDRADVEEAFRDLSRRYHALRDEVDDADSREAELEFKSVTEAYLDVEREMRRYSGRDRYAREED